MHCRKLINIIKSSAGKFLVPILVAKLIREISLELKNIYLSERVINNLKKILDNDYYLQVYSADFKVLTLYFKTILRIAAFSNYLTDIVVRNPEYLTEFLTDEGLKTSFTYEDFEKELVYRLNIYKTFDKKLKVFSRFRREHILRIGLKDLSGLANFYETSREYSHLTKAILDQAFKLALSITRIEKKIKIPPYCLVALGKLGGNELNYSSDVDLICVFDNTEEKYSSYVIEYYDKVIKHLIKICSGDNVEGYLYRLDFRLRPDGKYAPLARSIGYYQVYYQSMGREWERQMLLRASFVSGDYFLFEKFMLMLDSFVFQNPISPNKLIQRLRFYNEQVFDNSLIQNRTKNIKYFYGGIRNIEFTIQTLQLIYGHKYKIIKTGNIIDAITQLHKQGLINRNVSEKIKGSYVFFRKIENFIQLMDDRQTYVLPEEKEKLLNLLKYLKIQNLRVFNNKLENFRNEVIKFYESIFRSKESDKILSNAISKVNFKDQNESERILIKIFEYIISQFSKSSILSEKFNLEGFQNNLFDYLKNAENPDKCLQNFFKILGKFNSIYQLGEVVLDKEKLKIIILICDLSEVLFNYLMISNSILDFFISGKTFINLNEAIDLKNLSTYELDLLKFYLSVNFLTKKISTSSLSIAYSDFFDKYFNKTINDQSNDFKLEKSDFCLLALGSYGSRELHFKSDLDLVLIFSDSTDEKTTQKFSSHLLEKIKKDLQNLDYVDVDFRLKPEGTVSKLNWTLSEFKKYVNNRMRVWELMAYSDSRFISGNFDLFLEINNVLHQKIKSFNIKTLIHEVNQTRKKYFEHKLHHYQDTLDPKNNFGGITDFRFFRQKLKLCYINLSQNDISEFELLNHFFEDESKTLKLIYQLLKNHDKNLTKELKKVFVQMNRNYHKLLTLIVIGNVLYNKKNIIIGKEFNSKFIRKFFKIKGIDNIILYFNKILLQSQKILEKLNKEVFNDLD